MELPQDTEKTVHMKRELREHIAVPSSILFQDSPSLLREKVIAAQKAEHSVEVAITLWRSHTHKLEKWSSTSKRRLEYGNDY